MFEKWQLSRRTIRWIQRILIPVAIGFFLYFLPALFFQLELGHRGGASYLCTQLEKVLGTEVYIDEVVASSLGDIQIEGVTIMDLEEDTLLQAQGLRLGVSYLSLWNLIRGGDIDLTHIRLFRPHLKLRQDSSGQTNLSVLLDKLQGQSQSNSEVHFSSNNILLRDGQISYYKGDSLFFALGKLDAKIDSLSLGDSLRQSMEVLEMTFALANGFEVKDLTGVLAYSNNELILEDFDLMFGSSQINIPYFRGFIDEHARFMCRDLDLASLNILLRDLEPFHSGFSPFSSKRINARAKLSSKGQNLRMDYLNLDFSDLLRLNAVASLNAKDFFRVKRAFFGIKELSVKKSLYPLLKELDIYSLGEDVIQDLALMGNLQAKSTAYWSAKKGLSLDVELSSDLGEGRVEANGLFNADGLFDGRASLDWKKLRLKSYRTKNLNLSIPQISGNLLIRQEKSGSWQVDSKFKLPELSYLDKYFEAVSFKLNYGKVLTMNLNVDDPMQGIHLAFSGLNREQGLSDCQLSMKAKHLDLKTFGLDLYPERKFDCDMLLSMDQLSQDFRSLRLDIEQLESFSSQGVDTLNLNNMQVRLDQLETSYNLESQADWGTIRLKGIDQDFSIKKRFESFLYKSFPVLSTLASAQDEPSGHQPISLDLDLKEIPSLFNELFDLELTSKKPVHANLVLGQQNKDLSFDLKADDLLLFGTKYRNLSLTYHGGQFDAQGDCSSPAWGDFYGLKLNLKHWSDSLGLNVDFGLNEKQEQRGQLKLKTELSAPYGNLQSWKDLHVALALDSSSLRIHNLEWKLDPTKIHLSKDRLVLNGFRTYAGEHKLFLDGVLSNETTDSLTVRAEHLSLLYILKACDVNFDMLETDLSGDAVAYMRNNVFYVGGEVSSEHFYVEGYDAYAPKLKLNWDSAEKILGISGRLAKSKQAYALVNGGIDLGDYKGIDLLFSGHDFPLHFVQAFTDSFFNKLEGRANGNVRLFGLFRDGVTIEGEPRVDDAVVGISSIGTEYHFGGELVFYPTIMKFPSLTVYDDEGHTALFDGAISHNLFDDLDLQLNFSKMKNFKVLTNEDLRHLPLKGSAYCTGKADLVGPTSKLLLSVEGLMNAPTDLALDMNALSSETKDQSLIRFVSLRSSPLALGKAEVQAFREENSHLDMKFKLKLTPETKLAIRLSSERGDEIQTRAKGFVDISIPHIGSPMIYGDVKLQSGSYTLRLENVMNKKFRIREGGGINFRGDPSKARLDIQTVYSLTANISDLDKALVYSTQRTNMPVDCIVKLAGDLLRPRINFDVALPKASAEVERRVRSLLPTQEAVMQQALYLIGLGTFHDTQYTANAYESSNNWSAVVTSTLSDQISALLGSLGEKIQLGTNIKTRESYYTDTDIELLYSGQFLDNRLVLSGNVGYHDNLFMKNTYIGEFDLEYKLNKSGSLRLKTFNHYNNRYQYLRRGIMTQGFGILYRQKFDSFSELFTRKDEEIDFGTSKKKSK